MKDRTKNLKLSFLFLINLALSTVVGFGIYDGGSWQFVGIIPLQMVLFFITGFVAPFLDEHGKVKFWTFLIPVISPPFFAVLDDIALKDTFPLIFWGLIIFFIAFAISLAVIENRNKKNDE